MGAKRGQRKGKTREAGAEDDAVAALAREVAQLKPLSKTLSQKQLLLLPTILSLALAMMGMGISRRSSVAAIWRLPKFRVAALLAASAHLTCSAPLAPRPGLPLRPLLGPLRRLVTPLFPGCHLRRLPRHPRPLAPLVAGLGSLQDLSYSLFSVFVYP